MKEYLSILNKAFENRLRLAIMSMLMLDEWVDFNTFKEMLGVTDGNLASHISALEKADYIKVKKQFVGKKTNTSYSATKSGSKAFLEHLEALEKLIKKIE